MNCGVITDLSITSTVDVITPSYPHHFAGSDLSLRGNEDREEAR